MNNWQINATSSVTTVFIHTVIIYFVVVGWQLTTPKAHTPPVLDFVKAELVQLEPVAKPAPPKPRPVQPRPQPVKKVEPKPAPKPVVTPEPKPELKPEPKTDDSLQQEQLKRLQELLNEEEAQQEAQEQALQQLAEDQQVASSYASIIRQSIIRSWSRPPSARNGMEVTVAMQLTPNGQVVDVKVVEASGDGAFDRSAIRAIKQIGEFPEIKTMPARVFEAEFRNLLLVFRPEDLLL